MTYQEKINRMKSFATCYACESEKSSEEHAPPKQFFSTETRGNPIKVPSCDDHNLTKSKDDVYALWCAAGSEGINEAGRDIANTALKNSARHDWTERGGRLMQRINRSFIGPRTAIVEVDRLIGFYSLLARALYLFETGRKLSGQLHVCNRGNGPDDGSEVRKEHHFNEILLDCSVYGNFPAVFNYSIRDIDPSRILIRVTLYEAVTHWIYNDPGLGRMA